MRLEQLTPNTWVKGILPNSTISVVSVQWFGTNALELTYKDAAGKVGNQLLYRHDEPNLEIVEVGRPWGFDGDGHLFRLVSEAHRIRLAHLFDPLLAVHTSIVEPLPHQITAVYESMLPRQPLRYLLADDPGAGKTIMAGLLIKELMVRGDLQRCLIVCPGSLAEQWQDELYQRFNLPFEILTNDKLEAARTGNWFLENDLVIARLDKLSRNEDVQAKLGVPDCRFDLIVCDEAHKMSATFFGGEIKYTKRYRLGQLLATLTRHFLLMTATPHNGKEEDFQLFMALIDGDRFEGRFRDGVHSVDVSDLMRRMVKEELLKFDGRPLFPERQAYTVPYKLSDLEARLYREVTEYVREEFNRADALQNQKRAGTVGFALTILQRRLASSPEAIFQSLRRRRERLESRLRELELLQRGSVVTPEIEMPSLDADDIEDLDDAPDVEVQAVEEQILDQATAARTIAELKTEIDILRRLETLAQQVRRSGADKKWEELSQLLHSQAALFDAQKRRRKLVIFTEHRDTLNYLHERITTLLGRPTNRQDSRFARTAPEGYGAGIAPHASVLVIHGGIGREERAKVQEAFRHDPEVHILIATDAAGEGINLQRAHLMVNYDLPWNPNRIEQRFGRIHRIGQTEVCHLWNLVAEETREGEVYRALLDKLEEARSTLGGRVFNILGKVVFEGRPLRELLIEAVRYGEQDEVRARLHQVVNHAFDREQLQELLEERALAHTAMDISRVQAIREDMERAEARRLQPHYIQSFFLRAFRLLGGTAREREPRRFELTHVPATIRNRDRLIGTRFPVQQRYERITFEKDLVNVQGQPLAAFVCPGQPLLDATLDLTLERYRDLLKQGAVLVDERDSGREPRVLFYLEHAIQDAVTTRSGERRTISKQLLYIEIDREGHTRHIHYAPYLDYRPLQPGEVNVEAILNGPECAWIAGGAGVPPASGQDGRAPGSDAPVALEQKVQTHAVTHVVPQHLAEVRARKLAWNAKTEAAVKDRLTKEISYWDHRAEALKLQEQAGKPNARLNSNEARKRADALEARLQKRTEELQLESQISPLPPVILGGALVLPLGLLAKLKPEVSLPGAPEDTLAVAAKARAAIMAIERELGYDPIDRETEKLGYDIESRIPGTGRLRFIEVKGRVSGAKTITVTRNEILFSLNKPDDYILAIVEFDGDQATPHYVRQPFRKEPDFGVTSVNYDFAELLARATPPS
ncbi:MAG: helicase-related protein [Pseudomonadota bacterium]|jgi:SNF2 family DNA or RNA helicase